MSRIRSQTETWRAEVFDVTIAVHSHHNGQGSRLRTTAHAYRLSHARLRRSAADGVGDLAAIRSDRVHPASPAAECRRGHCDPDRVRHHARAAEVRVDGADLRIARP